MLTRTILGILALLTLLLLLLVNCASPSKARPAELPLTPPPVAPQPARIGPRLGQPTDAVTASVTVAPPLTVTGVTTPISTSAATTSPNTVLVVTPTREISFLPTVTPTPAPFVLLPTLTPTPPATVLASTPTAPLSPTFTTLATITPTVTATAGQTDTDASANVGILLPSPLMTVSVPLPASYEAQGSFGSQTVYTDSTIVQQQGRFSIIQSDARNAYGGNQQYTLSTQRGGQVDEINVYQIDDYILVSYPGGEWMLVRRDQGSYIVRAVQPITDLAILFPRIIDQAELVGQENIDGISTLRYRINDPTGQAARLVQPLLALSGDIRSLKSEVWIAVPGGYVVAYNFQVELAGARVLDADGNEVRADQAVSWTYQLVPTEEPLPIVWPADAPAPNAFPVPGFAVGEFPIPPNTELLTLVGGVPELISTDSVVGVDSFYRTELFELGWEVEGEAGLLRGNKEETTIQLLIADDTATGGTRITVIPGE